MLKSPLQRRFSIDVLWNIASLGVLAVAGIIFNVVIIRFSGPEALGVFNQVFAFYIFLSQFSIGGIHFSVLKHVSYHQQNFEKCRSITTSALVLAVFLSAIFVLLTYGLKGLAARLMESPGVAIGLGLAAPGLIGFSLNKVLLNVLNGLSHMRAFAVFQALRYILMLIGIIVIILLPIPDSYLAAALTFAEITLFLIVFFYINLKLFPIKPTDASMEWVKEHFHFGLRGFMGGALTVINLRIDVLVIGFFLSDKAVGIFSFASIIAEGFSQLPIIIRRNVDPLLGECFSSGDSSKISSYAKKIRKVMYPGMLLLGAAAVALYPICLKLFAHDQSLDKSFWVFAILMVGVVINSGYRPFLGIIMQGGRPGYHTLMVSILVLTNLIGNVLLVQKFGIYGSATATSFMFVLEALLIVVFARRLFRIRL